MSLSDVQEIGTTERNIPKPASPANPSDPATQNQLDYGSLLPSANQLGQFAPLTFSDMGQIPQVQAATMQMPQNMQAATIDPNTLPGALQQYAQLAQSTLAPQFQQQNQQLQAQLAQNGIFNSSAAGQAETNLMGNQDAALSSAISPLVADFANFYQQDQTGNAANRQAANAANFQGGLDVGFANQNATNNANSTNASTYGNIVQGDLNAANTYLQGLNTGQNTLDSGLLSSGLQTYDPSVNGSTNLINQGLGDASQAYTNAFNAAGQNSSGITNAISTGLQSLFTPSNPTNAANQVDYNQLVNPYAQGAAGQPWTPEQSALALNGGGG